MSPSRRNIDAWGAAEARRRLHQRLEHRLEVDGGAADDLEYVSGRGLLLQGLARLGNQPGILHRDDRRGCEIFKQRDLFVGERPDLLPENRKRTEQLGILVEGDLQQSTPAAGLDQAA